MVVYEEGFSRGVDGSLFDDAVRASMSTSLRFDLGSI